MSTEPEETSGHDNPKEVPAAISEKRKNQPTGIYDSVLAELNALVGDEKFSLFGESGLRRRREGIARRELRRRRKKVCPPEPQIYFKGMDKPITWLEFSKYLGVTRTGIQRQKLIDYLSDPENEWPDTACAMADALKINRKTFARKFPRSKLQEIELEALNIRRKRYARRMVKIDNALLKKAESTGDAQECRLAYEKFENWKKPTETKEPIDLNITIVTGVPQSKHDTEDPIDVTPIPKELDEGE